MDQAGATESRQASRLLVAIASYGEKHLGYLKAIIESYRSLPLDVRVVVVSEAPKRLGKDVEVVVGLPTKNPWSLPFAHKAIFAREADNYDLFVYSEDDILFTERNLHAFLSATPHLAPDEIAGFLLYEADPAGKRHLCNFHGHFHWKPKSLAPRGPHLVAEFSNEHSAFYMLTQGQLKAAIASGGYLRDPYEGRHDMLCAAATDPYTCCGFRKVICISDYEPFLLHHMPNRYLGRVGISEEVFAEQVRALLRIHEGVDPAEQLCELETKLALRAWSKSYYEKPDGEVLRVVPPEAKTILSVGCGWGSLEAELGRRGAEVTGVALDAVIGAVAARCGVRVVHGTLEECYGKLQSRRFDCVLISNLLHLQGDPAGLLSLWSRLVANGGTMIVKGINFDRMPVLFKRFLGSGDYTKLRDYEESGVTVCGPAAVRKTLRATGLNDASVSWINHALPGERLRGVPIRLGRLTAKDWILRASRSS